MSKILKYANAPSSRKPLKTGNAAILASPRHFEIAFSLVYAIIAAVFSTMVIVLDYCFPDSLDGTYLKLLF